MQFTPLTETEIAERLAPLTGWAVEDNTLVKTYALPTYLAGVAFACAVGTVAEGLNHHPDMHIGWRKVTVRFSTHDAGHVLTTNDFDAAAAVDALGYPKP